MATDVAPICSQCQVLNNSTIFRGNLAWNWRGLLPLVNPFPEVQSRRGASVMYDFVVQTGKDGVKRQEFHWQI
jgi:hypothetical protein